MNLKKIIASLISIIMLGTIAVLAFQSTANAAETAKSVMYIQASAINPNTKEGFAIRDPKNGGRRIWNFLEHDSETSSTYTVPLNYYCLRDGVGLGNDTDMNQSTWTSSIVTYNQNFNMKNQRDTISGSNPDSVLYIITHGNVKDKNGNDVDKYSALLALLDILYYPTNSNTDTDRKEFLNNAEITFASDDGEILDANMLTNEEIRTVQQAAIWYFTNYNTTVGDIENFYDNTQAASDGSWIWKATATDLTNVSNSVYDNITSGGSSGAQKGQQVYSLYQYLVSTAIENASNNPEKYTGTSSQLEAPATVTVKNSYKMSTDGNDYVIGPITITKTANSTKPYEVEFEVKNGNTVLDSNNYKILDKQGNEVTDLKNVEGEIYISVPKSGISTLTVNGDLKYSANTLTLWTYSTGSASTQPILVPETETQKQPFELTVAPGAFDLALRKYIVSVDGTTLSGANSRVPNIDENTLLSGTTATYKHKKDPVVVKEGSKVIYKLTIYNEGEKAGRATEIVDQLPTGLKFTRVVSGNFESDGTYNPTGTNTLVLKRIDGNETNLPAYTTGSLTSGTGSETIEIECEVTATADDKTSTILTNVAWISEAYNADDDQTITNQKIENESWADRDSEPSTAPSANKDNMSNYTGNNNKEDLRDPTYYYKGQQDDDDFEKLVLMPENFDLKLIKRIVSVNDNQVTERIKSIDVSNLNLVDANGNMLVDDTSERYTTANYDLNKDPVGVKKGDIVTYTFRVYNEGTINGYAQEITEDIPEGLEFLYFKEPVTSIEDLEEQLANDETLTQAEKDAILFNSQYLWVFDQDKIDENGKITEINTDYLAEENGTIENGINSNLIEAFGKNNGTKTENDLHYKEVSVKLKVISEDVSGKVIRNEACISDDMDENKKPVDDRDSKPEEWPGKDDHNKYQDDEDYDNIILQSFDLALRKFIVAVSKDETIEDSEYLKNEDGSYTRAPAVDTSKLNEKDENGNIKTTTAIYNHTKEPVLVQPNDIVVYNLRVYNEGEIDGYAAEIKDHLPPYLEFVDGEFNKKYGWTALGDGRTVTTKYLANEIIKKAEAIENTDGSENAQKYKLTYKEVPIMCKVKETSPTSENITNIADITLYLDENQNETTDRDSVKDDVKLPTDKDLPNYKGEETGSYIPGQQDDDDFEKVIIKKFDLALRKWVTQAIVIENGGQTVTETGHDAWDDPEQVVKVELHRKKINEVTVKFRYSIRVYNQGEIAGYAKEVTDYIPEGLKFVAEDNPGWTDEGNNVISTTLLADTLLQPGEYADVEVVLTWINNENNMGVMTNTAEISKDYNEYGVPDIDSTPDNQKPGEDDIDDAPVMLSVSTGQMRIYFTLGFIILITIAGGVVLIKKYVL